MGEPTHAELLIIRSDLKTYLSKNKNISQASFAKEIGYSSGAISSFISASYKGDVNNLADKIRKYLIQEKEKINTPSFEAVIVQTSITSQVNRVARYAHNHKKLCVVYSAPGSGKTVAVKEYARKKVGVILIEADLSIGPKTLFKMLHDELNCSGSGTVHEMLMEVIRELKGTNKLLIIDEAEQLPYKALELVRRIWDKAKIGVLLSGTKKLIQNLRGKRGEYAQLYSRVAMSHEIEALKKDDAKMIIAANLPAANELWEHFYTYCRRNARILGNHIDLIKAIFEDRNIEVTVSLIDSTAEKLIG